MISVEFTQQEIDLLSCYLGSQESVEDYWDIDDMEELEKREEIYDSVFKKINEKATKWEVVETETVLVPDCIFPPGFADQLISMGLARRATPEEVREEFARYEQDRIG